VRDGGTSTAAAAAAAAAATATATATVTATTTTTTGTTKNPYLLHWVSLQQLPSCQRSVWLSALVSRTTNTTSSSTLPTWLLSYHLRLTRWWPMIFLCNSGTTNVTHDMNDDDVNINNPTAFHWQNIRNRTKEATYYKLKYGAINSTECDARFRWFMQQTQLQLTTTKNTRYHADVSSTNRGHNFTK